MIEGNEEYQGDIGLLQLSSDSFSVDEDEGTVTITVIRSEGSYGDVSVDYSIVDETAVSGEDYLITDGTLYFSDGEIAQAIQIDIVDDNTVETSESFSVVLLNPVSAFLGDVTEATVSIEDNDKAPTELDTDTEVEESSGGGSTNALLFLILLCLCFSQKKINLIFSKQ